jgi:hypothetical protein
MKTYLLELKLRNETLFWFGLLCLAASLAFLLLTKITQTQVYGVNAWFKPFKFAFSTFTLVWAMAWYMHYLSDFKVQYFNWAIIILLGFEILYIAIMAGLGKQSHYNISTPFYSAMYSLMAFAASAATLCIAYVAYLFFMQRFPDLPDYYVWAIRLGMVVFVIFSFEGFAMGARMNHSVGLLNDNSNLFILGWSCTVGDLRVAHFLGMHALQILPLLSFYLLRSTKLTFAAAALYLLLAAFTLFQALKGKPLIALSKAPKVEAKVEQIN